MTSADNVTARIKISVQTLFIKPLQQIRNCTVSFLNSFHCLKRTKMHPQRIVVIDGHKTKSKGAVKYNKSYYKIRLNHCCSHWQWNFHSMQTCSLIVNHSHKRNLLRPLSNLPYMLCWLVLQYTIADLYFQNIRK